MTISVLLCSMPADGHVRPMAAVARTLVQRGWRVRFLTGAAYVGLVRATGAEFLALPLEADQLDQLEHDDTLKGTAAINEGVKRAFFDPAPAAYEGVRAALAAEPVDAVLHETTFLGTVGLHQIPSDQRPITVMCGILPLGLSSRDTAPFGLGITPMPGPFGRIRNRILTWAATKIILAPAHRQADAMLRELGAPTLDGRFFMDILTYDDLLAQFTVSGFEYPRTDAPSSLRFFGPTARLSTSETPLPDWWSQLDGSRPVVHVSQGTVANTNFDELIRPTLNALADQNVTVVVSTGGRRLGELRPLPPNALAASFIPYDKLFPKTNVFITNGGYGGLHYAMEHGVPVIVAGETEDKTETAARVAWSGIGINLKTSNPTPESIRRAVQKILTNPKYAAASARIGHAIAASPGVAGLADELEKMILERRSADRSHA